MCTCIQADKLYTNWYTDINSIYILYASRLTVVSREAKKQHARTAYATITVSYLHGWQL